MPVNVCKHKKQSRKGRCGRGGLPSSSPCCLSLRPQGAGYSGLFGPEEGGRLAVHSKELLSRSQKPGVPITYLVWSWVSPTVIWVIYVKLETWRKWPLRALVATMIDQGQFGNSSAKSARGRWTENLLRPPHHAINFLFQNHIICSCLNKWI